MKKILLAIFALLLSSVLFAQSPTGAKSDSLLTAYAGIYSSPSFHRKITIRVKEGSLEAEATGQGSILLDAVDKNTFRFDGVDVTLEFDAKARTMKLTQHGKELLFTKE